MNKLLRKTDYNKRVIKGLHIQYISHASFW